MHTRYPEIDLLRASAIIGMIIYHAAYDLAVFYGWNIDVFSGEWLIFQRTIASVFLLLVGISFAISYDRTPKEMIARKFLQRGFLVIGCGMLVSIATYIIDPMTFVRFGILHLIGVSILLLPLFARLKWLNAAIGLLFMIVGYSLTNNTVDTFLFIPFGWLPPSFSSVDYFPLLPWFGIVLLGHTIGHYCYTQNNEWRFPFQKLEARSQQLGALTFISKNSLAIYLLHQPLIIALLWLFLGPPN